MEATKTETQERPWEKNLGGTVIARAKNAGVNARVYRSAAHLPAVSAEQQQAFSEYIHKLGANVLQLQFSDAKQEEMQREEHKRRTNRVVTRLLKHQVKVHESEEGALSIVVDKEWDTSRWPDEMIVSGCEALILIFNDPEASVPLDRKERAVFMLQKLIYRHEVVVKYIKRNIELMIGQAVNRRIRNGMSAGQLDLLYVLHGCRERFNNDMSVFNFTGRAHEMLLLEARLAAIMIQHTFRAYQDRRRIRPIIAYTEAFGTAEEMKALRESVIRTRNRDLRSSWHLLHILSTTEKRNTIMGMRGPVHVGVVYTKLILEIILELVSEKAGMRAASNREDVVRSNGYILLTNFLASPDGPFATLACHILTYIARVAESIFPLIICSCAKGCLKFLRHHRALLAAVPAEVWRNKTSRANKEALALRYSLLDCIQMLTMLGTHASGVLRARMGFHFTKPARGDMEAVNYQHILESYSDQSSPEHILLLLGKPALYQEIVDIMLETTHLGSMQFILKCVFAVSCSDLHPVMLTAVMSNYGKPMKQLVRLLEEEDMVVCTLAMSILVQLNSRAGGRAGLLSKGITRELSNLTKSSSNYSRKPYLRAWLVGVSLLRQVDWRPVEPQEYPEQITAKDALRKAIFLDLLKTIKNPALEVADKLTIADLVILPTPEDNYSAAASGTMKSHSSSISKMVMSVPAKDLSDFLCHPHDENYFLELPWDESCAVCTIFEVLSTEKETALVLISSSVITFLSKCLFQARYLFTGNSLSDGKLMVVLNGVASSANALANFTFHSHGLPRNIEMLINVMTYGNVMDSSSFFIDTLSVAHPQLEESLRVLQVHVGMSVIRFFDCYASMLLSAVVPNSEAENGELEKSATQPQTQQQLSQSADQVVQLATQEIINLKAPGRSVTRIIKTLKKVHGVTTQTTEKLDHMCKLLCKLTLLVPGADAALNEWRIFDALVEHLPMALSGIGENGIFEDTFVRGLGTIPPSMFELCANISQLNDGRAHCLVDGFLRRALDKLSIVHPHLEHGSDMFSWSLTLTRGENLVVSAMRQDAIGCLKLVIRLTNFTHQKYGAANDLILMDKYEIVRLCKAMLSVKECPRKEKLCTLAIELLCALSKDNLRTYVLFSQLDIMTLIRDQLVRVEEMTIASLGHCIEIITNFASGYRTPYMMHVFPTLREPLIKVNRFYPKLSTRISDCNWAMTKVTSSAALEEKLSPFDQAIEDFIRGKTNNVQLPEEKDDSSITVNGVQSAGRYSSGSQKAPLAVDIDADVDAHEPGSYTYCGVSSCGSLRLPLDDSGSFRHGSTASLSEEDMKAKLLDLSSTFSDGLCDVSQLSAREKDLQRLIEVRKVQHGFSNKELLHQGANKDPPTRHMRSSSAALSKSLPDVLMPMKSVISAGPLLVNSSPKSGAGLRKAKSLRYEHKQKPLLAPIDTTTTSSASKAGTLLSPIKAIDLQDCPELLMTRPPPPQQYSSISTSLGGHGRAQTQGSNQQTKPFISMGHGPGTAPTFHSPAAQLAFQQRQ